MTSDEELKGRIRELEAQIAALKDHAAIGRELKHQLRRLDVIAHDEKLDALTASQFAVGRVVQLINFLRGYPHVVGELKAPVRTLLLLWAALGELSEGALPPMFDVERKRGRHRTGATITIRAVGAAAVDRLQDIGETKEMAIDGVAKVIAAAVDCGIPANRALPQVKRAIAGVLKDHGRFDEQAVAQLMVAGAELSAAEERPHQIAVVRGLWYREFADRNREEVLDIVAEQVRAHRGHIPKYKRSDKPYP